MLAFCCLLFRERQASQLHCLATGLASKFQSQTWPCWVTCLWFARAEIHWLVLPPPRSIAAITLAVFRPRKYSKTSFFMLLPCWPHVRSLPCQLVKALRTWVQPGEKTPLVFFFPPRIVCARDAENQIPQIWGLCQLSLQADRGSCCRSTYSNCYFISICFIAP